MSMVAWMNHLTRGGPPRFEELKHMKPQALQKEKDRIDFTMLILISLVIFVIIVFVYLRFKRSKDEVPTTVKHLRSVK
jgi:heme/copper-type cytochrome/quinol oxidase subunit 2